MKVPKRHQQNSFKNKIRCTHIDAGFSGDNALALSLHW